MHGTVVTLDPDRAAAALAALDRYEGHEYRRITVRTEAGREAATYAWTAPLTGAGRSRRALDGRAAGARNSGARRPMRRA